MGINEALEVLDNGTKQKLVLQLLRKGGKYSVCDISIKLHLSDPRGHIRDLREKGVKILDEWRKAVNGHGKYKVYYLEEPTK